jgi:hypothetical protein
MSSPKHSEALEGLASDPPQITNTGPPLRRASIPFVASLGSFVGASLLLTGI